ncbi:origin recognition complex subunit 4 [Apiospora marii]|uniref:Origin recognition complex subunit 4 n=1 Tax=Apiospora marii TaxID=335849 RepID=A0ABR1S8R7_9PEZI
MAPEPATTRRKRTRLQDAQDEIASDATSSEPAATAKKRKLNAAAASSAANGPAVTTATRSSARATARTASSTKAPNKAGTTKVAAEPVVPAVKVAKLQKLQADNPPPPVRPAVKPAVKSAAKPAVKPAVKARALSAKRSANNIYDVPDSGDELELQAADESKKSAPRTKKQANGVSKSASGPAKPVASKGKSVVAKNGEPESKQPASRKPRGRLGKIGQADTDESDQLSDTVKPAVKQPRVNKNQAWLQNSPSKDSPAPKGILTPRHKKAGRPRKNVAFDSGSKKPIEEVFFEDLPSVAKSARSKATKQVIEASDDDEEQSTEDNEICVICSKPDSEAPNQILFCEHCDKGFHQECYGVPVIPEDDWFCKDCLQEDIVPGAQNSVQVSGASSAVTECPDIPNFDRHLKSMQRVLLDRCSGSRRVRLKGQDEAYDKTYQLVEQTVLAGEGNSMMVIGARGCGKTLLVETIMSDLATENTESFHVIRLSGFIHTDDKLALKEIWRQLGKEMEVEDDLNKTSNYADTLASLLALLSHPSEITGTDEGVTSKSVVFVIDEFDLFATHARQTLLYNLFDIAQARKAPIAVLGLTTRIDVVESLEKRVKSRFSHRYSVPAFWDICRQGLVVEEEDLDSEGFDVALEGLDEFRRWWEGRIEVLRETPSFQDHLDYHFYTSKSVAAFFTSLIMPLSTLSPSSLDLKVLETNLEHVSLEAPDSKHHLVAALSDLELAMLIAAARLDIVAHTDTVNFAMAYDEYSSQMGKQRVQAGGSGMLALGAGGRVWGRGVAGMAWERLASLGLMIPAGIGGRSNSAHGGLEGKMFKLEVVLEEIPGAVELPGFLTKWCTQI